MFVISIGAIIEKISSYVEGAEQTPEDYFPGSQTRLLTMCCALYHPLPHKLNLKNNGTSQN